MRLTMRVSNKWFLCHFHEANTVEKGVGGRPLRWNKKNCLGY